MLFLVFFFRSHTCKEPKQEGIYAVEYNNLNKLIGSWSQPIWDWIHHKDSKTRQLESRLDLAETWTCEASDSPFNLTSTEYCKSDTYRVGYRIGFCTDIDLRRGLNSTTMIKACRNFSIWVVGLNAEIFTEKFKDPY